MLVHTIDTSTANSCPLTVARKLRIQFPGAIYHVINRGDPREAIAQDDEAHQKFYLALGEAWLKTDWQVHAYCLMSIQSRVILDCPSCPAISLLPPPASLRSRRAARSARSRRRVSGSAP